MSKLFNMKEWLPLDGAAKRLSDSFGETVTEADVIQMALDGHLRLSLRLLASHLYALRWYKKRKTKSSTRKSNITHTNEPTRPPLHLRG